MITAVRRQEMRWSYLRVSKELFVVMLAVTWLGGSCQEAETPDRVEITFHNMLMMAHPMHLHGHAFQVVGIGMVWIAGRVRETDHVLPLGMVTIAVDAVEASRWMLHFHHMAHLATAMMTELTCHVSFIRP